MVRQVSSTSYRSSVAKGMGGTNTTNATRNGSDQRLGVWRESRSVALHELEEELRNELTIGGEGNETTDTYSPHTPRSRKFLVLMDDNFHLRSMRRDDYRVCRDFLTKLHTARKNNSDTKNKGNDNQRIEARPSSRQRFFFVPHRRQCWYRTFHPTRRHTTGHLSVSQASMIQYPTVCTRRYNPQDSHDARTTRSTKTARGF